MILVYREDHLIYIYIHCKFRYNCVQFYRTDITSYSLQTVSFFRQYKKITLFIGEITKITFYCKAYNNLQSLLTYILLNLNKCLYYIRNKFFRMWLEIRFHVNNFLILTWFISFMTYWLFSFNQCVIRLVKLSCFPLNYLLWRQIKRWLCLMMSHKREIFDCRSFEREDLICLHIV